MKDLVPYFDWNLRRRGKVVVSWHKSYLYLLHNELFQNRSKLHKYFFMRENLALKGIHYLHDRFVT